MDANNVFVIITPLQNSNVILDWIFSIIGNGVISVIGGIFAAIISVYITIDFTVRKGDAIKFNKIMIKVVFEIKEIKRKMDFSYFDNQIKKMRMKAQQRKEGTGVWVGFDKEDYAASFITRFQFLPVYWLSVFFLQIFDLYGDEESNLSQRIQFIKNLYHLSLEFNRNLQYIESRLDFELKNIESNPNVSYPTDGHIANISVFDSAVEKSINDIKKKYEESKFQIDDLIYKINPENEDKLLINVKFWPTIFKSL